MPPLGTIEEAEQLLAARWSPPRSAPPTPMLRALDLPAVAPGAGHLLSGAYAQSPALEPEPAVDG